MTVWLARLCLSLGISLATLTFHPGTVIADFRFPAGSGGVNAPEHLDKPYLVLVSIATDLYPDRHGLVGNAFPAPELGPLVCPGQPYSGGRRPLLPG